MARIVEGLLICGLSYDGSINPTLFTNGPLDVTTISGLSPLTTSSVLVQRLPAVAISGATARISDLRDPLISSTAPTVILEDDKDGTLSRFFAPDPGYENTTRWTLLDRTVVTKAATSIVLVGSTAPTVNQIIYLGNEAIRIDAVTTSHDSHTCTVTRGVAGSRAVVHALDPSAYPPGDDGSRECLIAYSRRVYDETRQIECALYRFKMSDTNPHAISSVLWVWYGYLNAVPKCNDKNEWSISVKHFTQAIAEHQVKATEPIELEHCVQVLTLSNGYSAAGSSSNGVTDNLGTGGNGSAPITVVFRFTVYEFERLFNMNARAAQSSRFGSSSLMSEINTILGTTSNVYLEIVGEVGGHTWVWRVQTVVSSMSANKEVGQVIASLVSKSQNASVTDNPISFDRYGDNPSAQGYNEGFVGDMVVNTDEAHRVKIEQGETAPKVYTRLRISPAPFAEAALSLMLSGYGDGSNDATYDTIPGFRGMNFNPDWINIGTATGNPKTTPINSQEWADHLEIDDEPYNYALVPGTKLGDWFRNELLLRNMILAFVPSTGKIGPRIWVRAGATTALTTVTYPETSIDYSETLKEQRAIFLERGIHPVTLEPRYRKPLQDIDARNVDLKAAPTVRIWKDGGRITDEELQSGNLALFLRAVFGVGVGSPRVFQVPLALDTSVGFAELVTLTQPFVPAASGLGFTAKRLIVLGIDPVGADGVTYAYCLEDLVNLDVTANARDDSRLGSALDIKGIVDIDTTSRTATFEVDAIDYTQGFRVDTSDLNLWTDIKDAGGKIVIRTEFDHNPTDTAGERAGYQEIYATVTALEYNEAARKSYLSVSWTAAMAATRNVSAEDVIALGSIVQLPDYRPASAAPSSTAVQPISNQGYASGAGANVAHVSAISRRPLFNSKRSIIGT